MNRVQIMVSDEIFEKLEYYSKFYGVSRSALANFIMNDGIDELDLEKLRERCEGASMKQIIQMFKLQGHR